MSSPKMVFGKTTKAEAAAMRSLNPAIDAYGRGPLGVTCKGCHFRDNLTCTWSPGMKRIKATFPSCKMFRPKGDSQ